MSPLLNSYYVNAYRKVGFRLKLSLPFGYAHIIKRVVTCMVKESISRLFLENLRKETLNHDHLVNI